MDQSTISKILGRFRGVPEASAAEFPPQSGTPSVAPPASPMLPNQGLEQAAVASGGQIPMNPMLSSIMQHLGMMNFIRNRMNTQVVDPTYGQ